MPTSNEKLQHIIERICAKGCDHVNEIIISLEQQTSIEETRELDEQECRIVLHELKTIMAVYDKE
ncbi:MAG: hypothetical protein OEM07_07265 [Gammaproteobacteria bacterium]|nr:hypothetical protein [Gammaproteobacteria bacterium]